MTDLNSALLDLLDSHRQYMKVLIVWFILVVTTYLTGFTTDIVYWPSLAMFLWFVFGSRLTASISATVYCVGFATALYFMNATTLMPVIHVTTIAIMLYRDYTACKEMLSKFDALNISTPSNNDTSKN